MFNFNGAFNVMKLQMRVPRVVSQGDFSGNVCILYICFLPKIFRFY
jgi:hypothetical protein